MKENQNIIIFIVEHQCYFAINQVLITMAIINLNKFNSLFILVA